MILWFGRVLHAFSRFTCDRNSDPPQPLVKAEPKVHPRSVRGLFRRWRWFFMALTQIVLDGLCWIPWNRRQAVLFNLEARRFYLFDLVLWLPETVYLALLLGLVPWRYSWSRR